MKIDVFHIGPQKTATTWVYECLSEHPEIITSKTDTVHYYDIFYYKGNEWYTTQFLQGKKNEKIFDPTYTYIRSPWVPRRIAKDNPNAKFIVSLRNPIDRAFSHYWHEKKKQKIAFEFSEVLENYDLYSSWIEPGLYAEHIERYLEYFDREQFLFLKFNLLKKDPKDYLNKILTFIDVDTDFIPSVLNEKKNPAVPVLTSIRINWMKLKDKIKNEGPEDTLRKLKVDKLAKVVEKMPLIRKVLHDKDEYERGVPEEVKEELEELVEPEIQRLEKLLDINLDEWRQ